MVWLSSPRRMVHRLLMVLLCTLPLCAIAAPPPAQQRWVVVGDSISAAYGMALEQGWVAQFQSRLQQQGYPIKVVNESISGDTTAGGRARLPDLLARHQPSAVIIELGGNDGLRGLSPTAMADNLRAMIEQCRAAGVQVYLFGIKIPPNYGRRYTDLFEAAFATVAQQTQVPLLPFFLDGVGGIETLMQGDRIHPDASAQQILVDNAWQFLLPYLKAAPPAGDQRAASDQM